MLTTSRHWPLSYCLPILLGTFLSLEVDVWGEENLTTNEHGTPNTYQQQSPQDGKAPVEETVGISPEMQTDDTKITVLNADNTDAAGPPVTSVNTVNILIPNANGNEKG